MSVYAKDPGDTDRVICCASWSAAPAPGRDSCDEEATEDVDGDPFCARHAKEARAERLKSEERIGVGIFELPWPPPRAKAPCGCDWTYCDACDARVPRGEIAHFGPESSGSAQCDTSCCAACRGADPKDVHPTCETCGSCDVCSCPDKTIARVSALLGEDLGIEAAPLTGTTPEDLLRLQDHQTEDYE